MCPLNIKLFPLPVPSHRPTTLARPSSTSCHVTLSPASSSARRMYRPISSSSPVGLGMFTTSQHMATISSSRICERMAFARSSFIESWASAACGVIVVCLATKVVRIGAKLLTTVGGHQEIVFEAQAPATFPVNAGFDGPDHAGLHRSGRCLMRVWRLMRAGAHAVSDGMRGLPGITGGVDSFANDAVDIGHRSAVAHGSDGIVEDFQQLIQELVVSGR